MHSSQPSRAQTALVGLIIKHMRLAGGSPLITLIAHTSTRDTGPMFPGIRISPKDWFSFMPGSAGKWIGGWLPHKLFRVRVIVAVIFWKLKYSRAPPSKLQPLSLGEHKPSKGVDAISRTTIYGECLLHSKDPKNTCQWRTFVFWYKF